MNHWNWRFCVSMGLPLADSMGGYATSTRMGASTPKVPHPGGPVNAGSPGTPPFTRSRATRLRISARAGGGAAISSVPMNDRVHGTGFSYDVRIGFHEYERHIRQRIVIDFEAETDWREAARADRAKDIVDYYEANLKIGRLIEEKEYRLIEAVAEEVAHLLIREFPITRARVKVTKAPFDMPNVGNVAVECWRSREDFELA